VCRFRSRNSGCGLWRRWREGAKLITFPLGVRLRGRLDRAGLKRALDRIVARHEALRTTFAMVDGEPRQRIAPVEEGHFHLLEQDLRQHLNAQGEFRASDGRGGWGGV